MTNDDNQCRKGVGCDEQCRTCARSKANATTGKTQDNMNSEAFDITVRGIMEISEGMDNALRYLHVCVDNINESGGGYTGEYTGVYLAVAGMDDVLSAIEDAEMRR